MIRMDGACITWWRWRCLRDKSYIFNVHETTYSRHGSPLFCKFNYGILQPSASHAALSSSTPLDSNEPPEHHNAVMAFAESHIRSNPDGSISSINHPLTESSEDPRPRWRHAWRNWQTLNMCRWTCVKDTDPNEVAQGRHIPPVRYLEQRKERVRDCTEEIKDVNTPAFDLARLPAELQIQVFREVLLQSEPYTLRGVIRPMWGWTRRDDGSMAFVPHDWTNRRGCSIAFWECRTWRDIPWFSVCRASRAEATRVYGDPRLQTVPFSQRKDSVELSVLEQPGRHGSCRSIWHDQNAGKAQVWAYPSPGTPVPGEDCPMPNRCRGRCLGAAAFCRKRGIEEILSGLEKLSVRLGPVFDADVCTLRWTLLWCDAWNLISHLSPGLKHLTVLGVKSDLCTGDFNDADNDYTIEAQRLERERWLEAGASEETRLHGWLQADMMPMIGVRQMLMEADGWGLFSALTTFEIRLVESVCRRDMLAWSEHGVGGEWQDRPEPQPGSHEYYIALPRVYFRRLGEA